MQEYIELSRTLKSKKSSDISVHNIGFEDCSPGYHYGPRICPYHIIHFVTKGRGVLSIHQERQEVHAGEAFFIPAEQVASYEASKEDPWTYSWIGFLGTGADSFVRQLLVGGKKSFVITSLNTDRYAGLIEEGAMLSGTSMANYYKANSLLLSILSELATDLTGRISVTAESTLADEIGYYLEMKYSEPVTMMEAARHFGIHPNYLTRIFRERYGITPKKFLQQIKMKKAGQMLRKMDMSIGLIAQALGFEDQMAFSKCFRKEMGMSPSDYRRHMEGEGEAGTQTQDDFVTYL